MEFPEKPAVSRSSYYCCVFGCDSSTRKSRKLSFHSFPRQGARKVFCTNKSGKLEKMDAHEAWNLQLKFSKMPSKNAVVCSLHFKPEDYFFTSLYSDTVRQRRLKLNAVPSQNLPRATYESNISSTEKNVAKTNTRKVKKTNSKKKLAFVSRPSSKETLRLGKNDKSEKDNFNFVNMPILAVDVKQEPLEDDISSSIDPLRIQGESEINTSTTTSRDISTNLSDKEKSKESLPKRLCDTARTNGEETQGKQTEKNNNIEQDFAVMIRPADEYDHYSISIAKEMRKMDRKQQIFCEKLINTVIKIGQLGKLNENFIVGESLEED